MVGDKALRTVGQALVPVTRPARGTSLISVAPKIQASPFLRSKHGKKSKQKIARTKFSPSVGREDTTIFTSNQPWWFPLDFTDQTGWWKPLLIIGFPYWSALPLSSLVSAAVKTACMLQSGIQWLRRQLTGSNPNPASRLLLSRLGQQASTLALVLPSDCMATGYRKGSPRNPVDWHTEHVKKIP
ncbi:hypothetical protein CSKR_105966 [Clonorchis sinensis]|uniref:Uncharacterized protein n=1 Tax=Clonorchis sinensis TaxID=79923 RepID=A0A419PZA0_CLOSI|nr:hypothetical protein CSKR_105966 [Clonorchis sinensis]